jgi:hypothetical protein
VRQVHAVRPVLVARTNHVQTMKLQENTVGSSATLLDEIGILAEHPPTCRCVAAGDNVQESAVAST